MSVVGDLSVCLLYLYHAFRLLFQLISAKVTIIRIRVKIIKF